VYRHSYLGGRPLLPSNTEHCRSDAWRARKQLRRLVRPGKRALAIGLGVGTAVSGLQQHGITVDVIELHSEVRVEANTYWLCFTTLTLHPGPSIMEGW